MAVVVWTLKCGLTYGGHMLERSKVRYAVVGLGWIAQEAVLPAFKNADSNSELAGLVTSDPEKADKVSREYDVKKVFRM